MAAPDRKAAPAGSDHAGYDVDFLAWTRRTAALLRSRRFDELDVERLAEEVDDMGKRERRELGSRLTVLLVHLLNWAHEAKQRRGSWEATLVMQRGEIEALLGDNPSLRSELAGLVEGRWPVAVKRAAAETGLPAASLAAACPWSVEQVLDDAFLPS